MPVEIGTAGLIALEPSQTWSGGILREVGRWKGNHDDVKTEAAIQAALGYDVSVDPIEGTPKSILSVTSPQVTGGDPEDVVFPYWELVTSLEEQDTTRHPTVVSFTSGMSASEREAFAQEVVEADSNGTLPSGFSGLSSAMQGFFLGRIDGETTYLVPRLTLRLSLVVPSYSAYVVGYSDMVKTISTASLLSHSLVTTYPLPSTIGTLPSGDWLIHPPEQIQSQDRQEVTIVHTLIHKESGGWGSWQYASV